MNNYDDIVIGSGINSLVCAALLARKGRRVCILEKNDSLGGCIATEELTLPGFRHDVLSSWHPLFVTSGAYAELGPALARHGLEYLSSDQPTAGLCEDGSSYILTTSRQRNLAELNKNDRQVYQAGLSQIEDNADLVFGALSQQLWRFSMLRLVCRSIWKRGLSHFIELCHDSIQSVRQWLTDTPDNRAWQACIAPWVLHVGLGPESASSALMTRVVAYTLETVGMPVVKGGSSNLVKAFASLIEQYQGKLLTNQEVVGITVAPGGRATGVITADGSAFHARRSVICNVTPQQLYGKLLPEHSVPENIKIRANAYRFGRADMQIHIALDAPPQWHDERLADVPLIHLSDGIDDLSKAVNQAERGLLPEHSTIVVGQPCAVDPSRAPAGKWILWLQLQELPSRIKGDAAGEIEVPGDGYWTPQIAEQYADRIIGRLESHIRNFQEIFLKRVVLSPSDLMARNCNLVGGDPYSGDCALDQNLLFRPTSTLRNHATTVENVYHIGASTHPGPGLSGGSGFLVGSQLTK